MMLPPCDNSSNDAVAEHRGFDLRCMEAWDGSTRRTVYALCVRHVGEFFILSGYEEKTKRSLANFRNTELTVSSKALKRIVKTNDTVEDSFMGLE